MSALAALIVGKVRHYPALTMTVWEAAASDGGPNRFPRAPAQLNLLYGYLKFRVLY